MSEPSSRSMDEAREIYITRDHPSYDEANDCVFLISRDDVVVRRIALALDAARAEQRAYDHEAWKHAIDAARIEERERVLAIFRNPTSDMLNRGADEIRRDVDPVQRRVRFLLDVMADMAAEIIAMSEERTSALTSGVADG